LAAAGVGQFAANIIPREAIAEIDVRTTADSSAPYLTGLIRNYVTQRGYTLLDHEPTDAERQRFPLMARLQEGRPADAALQPMDAPIRQWVEASLATGQKGGSPVLIRAQGGTVPTQEIVAPLKVPFVLVSVVNTDNNQHAYDENLRMGNYLSGMRSMLGLLTTPYP
jgi:acetylornithine deacetylase/succinyl-diaminopimelate desuccinylase-like protein